MNEMCVYSWTNRRALFVIVFHMNISKLSSFIKFKNTRRSFILLN